ncbi:uncharacterized protein LOC135435288 [Drosophila montana]|uniref:uncharacterized protein LOC135435288 n=1 Tax=Drosophila montana TaxID=40370 RepID=UPI00313B56EA
MGSRSIPQVDMLGVSKSLRLQRKPILKFVPLIGLSCVNYRVLEELDYFYLDCQNHRDYYRDPVNKMQRSKLFAYHHDNCGTKPDRNYEALIRPGYWVKERQPVVYPEKYSQRMNLGGSIRIDAHFSRNSSTVFKR